MVETLGKSKVTHRMMEEGDGGDDPGDGGMHQCKKLVQVFRRNCNAVL